MWLKYCIFRIKRVFNYVKNYRWFKERNIKPTRITKELKKTLLNNEGYLYGYKVF